MNEPEINLNQEILRLIAELDEFKGKWLALKALSPERLQSLRHVATIESIGSSTRIEGSKLTDAQVQTLLSNLTSSTLSSRDEQEVAGYAEAMDLVFQSHEELHLTENHIKQLHRVLLRHSSKDERHRGGYKNLSNNVVALDEHGNEIGVIFETTSPFDTPMEMEQLVRWTAKAVAEDSMHPLLIIAVFNVTFLAIHPFQDGNGRLSRILTTLLLLRSGYEYVPFASLESVIENNKELYYKALRRTQTTLKNEESDWEPWVGFFLRCLKKQKNNLATKIEKEQTESDSAIPALSLQVLKLLREHERLTSSEIAELTGANPNTLKVRLRELVKDQRIVRHGQARATWYTLH